MIEETSLSIGHTLFRLTGSKLFGYTPILYLPYYPATNHFMYDFNRFSNMLETEYIADQQLSLMIEHHFDGFIFNKIPGWKRLGLREVFITKMAVSSLNKNKVSFSDLPPQLKGMNGFMPKLALVSKTF